jgi:2-C-methyl-D-erythritol 4-phosphate cytidylyltransferase
VSVWTVVVAAGSGARFGAEKQFAPLGAGTVLDVALESARAVADGVVVVVPSEHGAHRWVAPRGVRTVPGGATRAASVRCGLAAVPVDAEVIIVHDAARPLASEQLFRAVVAAVRAGADGAVPGVPLPDTVKRVRAAVVVDTPPREELVAVQTPQAFRAAVLRAAHAGEPDATDDATLVERCGGRVVVVPGEPANVKITRPEDLRAAQAAVARR